MSMMLDMGASRPRAAAGCTGGFVTRPSPLICRIRLCGYGIPFRSLARLQAAGIHGGAPAGLQKTVRKELPDICITFPFLRL